MVAAGDEVPQALPLDGHQVGDRTRRVTQDPDPGVRLRQPDAELGLLTPDRERPDPPHELREPTDVEDGAPPEGHAGPDRVADGAAVAGQPGEVTAHDPAELRREPARGLSALPVRLDGTRHAGHGRVREAVAQRGDPSRAREGVVVQEGDDLARRRPDPGVPRTGQALAVGVGQDPAAAQLGGRPGKDVRGMVDDHDQLVLRLELGGDRGDAGGQVGPAPYRVGADDHRHRGVRRRAHVRPVLEIGRGAVGASPRGVHHCGAASRGWVRRLEGGMFRDDPIDAHVS